MEAEIFKSSEKQITKVSSVTEELKKEILSSNEFDDKVYLGREFKNDAVKLGKKKTWKPNANQKEKNSKIDEAKNLTALATEQTVFLHDTMEVINEQRKDSQDSFKDEKTDKAVWIEGRVSFLESVKFEKKMLTSGNIKAHFTEYMQLVNLYRDLSGIPEAAERLKSVDDPMKILTQRMKCYLEQNRLNLDGEILDDKVTAEVFKYTEETDKYFGVKEKKGNEFDPELIMQQKEMIGKVEETAKEKPFSEMNSAERISSIPMMREFLSSRQKQAEDYDEKRMKALTQKETIHYRELLDKAKNDIFEVKACLALAEAEARFMLADEENKDKYLKEAESAFKDYSRILARVGKEALPRVVGRDKYITKEQAVNTESDAANYEFKYNLRKCAEGIPADSEKMKELKAAILAYTNVTHYSVSSDEESKLLLKVIKLRKSPEFDGAKGLEEFDKMLYRLQNGDSNDIPDWKKIPPSLLVNCVDGDGAGIIPKETKAGKEKGSHRNAAIVSARKWVKLDKDTPLFSHEPTINDLRQGKVSNCYMLASTTSLVNFDPQLIKKCIRDNGDGSVTVRLFKPTQRTDSPRVPCFVRIPKAIPKLVMGGDILSSGALWMQLIERAAAQVGMFREDRSGYQSLWYGNGDEWLAILTGTSRSSVAMNDDLFDEIMHAKEKGRIYHAGTKDDAGPGMNSGHAYSVLGAEMIGGKRYVILRNPYANMSRVENEDGSVKLSTTFASSTADTTHGQFTMPFEEFLRSMKDVTLTEMDEAFLKEYTKEGDEKTLEDIAKEEEAAIRAKEEKEAARLSKPKIDLDEINMDEVEKEVQSELDKEKEQKTEEEKTEETKEEKNEEKKEESGTDDQNSDNGLGSINDWLSDDDF